MRSRPRIEVAYSRVPAVAGQPLHVEVLIESASETPCDGIELQLIGRERDIAQNDPASPTQRLTRVHFSQLARIPATRLLPGRYRSVARFDLPAELPPSYLSASYLIQYELDVRVIIPWWPDRRERYDVPLVAPRTASAAKASALFCSHDGGPQGKALYLELSLDSTSLEPGGVLAGALSVANLEWSRVRRVELAFVLREVPRLPLDSPAREVQRHRFVIREGAPEEGAPIPFRVQLPDSAAPSLKGFFTEVQWSLEARADVVLGRDATLSVPLLVLGPPDEQEQAHAPRDPQPARVAPVGSARRALVWAEVARRTGLVDEGERLTRQLTFASGSARLAISLEHRGPGGVWSVAKLAWPHLGLGLQVDEPEAGSRHGFERLVVHHPFNRLVLCGRDPAQAFAFLDSLAISDLHGFEKVSIDDDGCLLASAGGAHSVETLLSFVSRAVQLVEHLAERSHRIPMPGLFAGADTAWRAFAARTNGRLELGRPYVHSGTWDREAFSLGTRWSGTRAVATEIILPLARPPAPLSPLGERVVRDLRERLESLELRADAILATAPAPLFHPERLAPVLDRLAMLARLVREQPEASPYR